MRTTWLLVLSQVDYLGRKMIIVNSTNVGDLAKKRENCFVKMIVGLGESPVSLGTGSADFDFQAGGSESVSAGSVHLPGT